MVSFKFSTPLTFIPLIKLASGTFSFGRIISENPFSRQAVVKEITPFIGLNLPSKANSPKKILFVGSNLIFLTARR